MEGYTILKKRWRHLLSLFVFLSALTLYGQPTSGWVRPGSCNTGPYNEAILVSSTGIQVNTEGAVIENVDVTGMIKIYANNVTIRNFRINGNTTQFPIRLYNGVGNLTIEDGEIYNYKAQAVYPASNYTAKRIEVHESDGDGFKAGTNTIIESCWMHHLGKADGAHADGVQVSDGDNVTIRGNYFEGYPLSAPYAWNAAAMIKVEENKTIGSVLYENNWSDGGSFQVNIGDTFGCPASVIVRNNHFGGNARNGDIAPHKCGGILTQANNLLDPTGTSTIPACGNGSGGGSTVSVTGVTVSPTTLSLSTGQSSGLIKGVLPSNATNQSVFWSSSTPSVATVNTTSGLVTAVTAGSATITVTTVDGGYTANCSVTVTNPVVSSVFYCSPSGSMSNNGTSAATPWAKLQDVFSAGKTFNDGDIIYLMSGNHGTPVISESNGDVVTITKAPGETPVLTSVKFSGAANWLLSDVKINPEVQFPNQSVPLLHPVYPLFVNSMVQIEQSSDITVDNCQIISYENISAWTADDWNYKAWNGIYIQDNSQDITISHNNIKNVNFGYKVSSCTNAVMEYNTIENYCGDGIRPDAHGTVIQYNTVKNAYKTNDNHIDIIQVALTDIIGLEIRGNILLNYTDPNQPFRASAMGISLFDGMYYNCIIENNVVVTDHFNGIVVLGAENCTVINNTVIDNNDTGSGPSYLWIGPEKPDLGGNPSINNIISNNLCTDYILDAGIGVTDNNVEFAWADRDNYFTDFANFDLSLKAGSPAIDAGTSTNAPAIDITGTSRPQGSGVDVGAYEYVGGTSGTLPSPWTNGDIGAVATAGSASYAGGTFTVQGSGANIWNTADEFQFVYQQIEGDATIIARLNSLEEVHQWTKGGVMMRESLGANSINGNVFVAPVASNGSKFSYRATTGATSSEIDGPNVTAPYWLRLQRVGDTFTGSVSADGNSWTTVGSTTLNMSTTYYVGLSVVSLTDGTLATATFNNVSVQSSTPFVNTIPTIDAVSDVNVLDNAGQQTINLSGISDGDGNTQTVSVTAASSNTGVANNVSVNYTSGNATGTLFFDPVAAGTATVTVTVTDNGGTENGGVDTKTITFDVIVTASVVEGTSTLNPIADAFVRGGTYDTINYGGEVNLDIKTASASYTRQVFLKFDLSSISNPTSAILRLYAITANSTQTLYLVNDNSWTESGITYSNKPASGSVLNTSVTPVLNDYVEIDILSAVQSKAGGLLSLQFVGNGSAYTAYSSKEGAYTPELVIESDVAATALIDEDFSAGSSDFTLIAGGTWAVSGGSYVLSNPGDASVGLLGNISIHNTEVTGDFELNTTINITGTTSLWNDAAVVFNHQGVGSNSYYYVSLNESNDGNTSGIFKVVNGTSTELCDITTAAATGVDYELQIVKTGSSIVVNLNGSQIASATDATLTDGFVGYGSKNDGATFDDLVVWAGGSSSSGKLENMLTESGTVNNISSMKIYPNPLNSDNPLNIKLEGYDTYDMVNVNIIDLAGRSVYNQLHAVDKSELKIKVNNLTRGVYIVSLTGTGINKQQKLIVKR